MIIDCISDTHNQHDRIKLHGGDLLIHAGDFSSRGTPEEVQKFIEWLAKQPYTYKVFISGNHDKSTEKALKNTLYKTCFDMGINYLCDSGVVIEGLNIWGSPWSPKFGYGWAWNAYRTESEAIIMADGLLWIKEKWDLIPEQTDILITHGPVYGILDKVMDFNWNNYKSVGCQALKDVVNNNLKLKLFISGHIHESAGTYICQSTGTIYVNASQLNEAYQLIHKPRRIVIINGSPKIEESLE